MLDSSVILICPADSVNRPLWSLKSSCAWTHMYLWSHDPPQRNLTQPSLWILPFVGSDQTNTFQICWLETGGTSQLPWQPLMSPLRRASICPYPLLQDHSTYITLASRGGSQTVCAIDCFSNLPGRELELWVGNFLSMSSFNCRDAWMPWWWYKTWVFICKICQNSLIVNMPLADVTYKISCQKGLFWE